MQSLSYSEYNTTVSSLQALHVKTSVKNIISFSDEKVRRGIVKHSYITPFLRYRESNIDEIVASSAFRIVNFLFKRLQNETGAVSLSVKEICDYALCDRRSYFRNIKFIKNFFKIETKYSSAHRQELCKFTILTAMKKFCTETHLLEVHKMYNFISFGKEKVSGVESMILLLFAEKMNNGKCWVSQKDIAKLLSLSERAVRKCTADLLSKSLISYATLPDHVADKRKKCYTFAGEIQHINNLMDTKIVHKIYRKVEENIGTDVTRNSGTDVTVINTIKINKILLSSRSILDTYRSAGLEKKEDFVKSLKDENKTNGEKSMGEIVDFSKKDITTNLEPSTKYFLNSIRQKWAGWKNSYAGHQRRLYKDNLVDASSISDIDLVKNALIAIDEILGKSTPGKIDNFILFYCSNAQKMFNPDYPPNSQDINKYIDFKTKSSNKEIEKVESNKASESVRQSALHAFAKRTTELKNIIAERKGTEKTTFEKELRDAQEYEMRSRELSPVSKSCTNFKTDDKPKFADIVKLKLAERFQSNK